MEDPLGQAQDIWKYLDYLAQNKPDKYFKLIKQTLEDGEKNGLGPPEHCFTIQTHKIPKVIPFKDVYINVNKWKQVPGPKTENSPIPMKASELREELVDNKLSYIFDVGINPEVLEECLKDEGNIKLLVKILIRHVKEYINFKLSKDYKIIKGEYKGNKDYLLDFMCPLTLKENVKGAEMGLSDKEILSRLRERRMGAGSGDGMGIKLDATAPSKTDAADVILPSQVDRGFFLKEATSTVYGRDKFATKSEERNREIHAESEKSGTFLKVPEFTESFEVKNGDTFLLIKVSLPGVESMKDYEADIIDGNLKVFVPDKYELDIKLSKNIDEDDVEAIFARKTSELIVKMKYMEIYDEDTLTEYEMKRQRNIISNYEFMKSCGLPVKPLIYVKNKSPNDMPEEEEFIPPNSDDEDDTWFPNESEAKKFNQIEEKKLEPTYKHKPIFKKVRNPCALFGLPKPDVGDKKKLPTKRKSKEGTEEVSSKSILKRAKINPIRQRTNKETGISTIVKKDQENQPVNRYPKRKQRIDYREAEVPDDDHYLYCEECEDFNHGDCPIHGPLVPVEDNKVDEAMLTVETKARASLPSSLQIKSSSIPHAGLGVFACEEIEPGVRFGPYQGKKVQKGSARDGRDTSYMWEIMRDGDVHYYIDGKDENVGNWLRFINCARNEVEQNLVAYQYYNEIYYRAYKKIGVGKELLVWYGDDYAKDLGIEDSVDTNEENWNQQLKSQTQRCEVCKKLFDAKFLPSHANLCQSRNTGLENEKGRHCDVDSKGRKTISMYYMWKKICTIKQS
eukprot:gene19464-21387_t